MNAALAKSEAYSDDSASVRTKEKKTRLVGWLVSYAINERGVSYELRSGRILISSRDSNDKGSVAVVDKTVSAPHAALNASVKHTVVLQDIFSDHGTFICRSGTTTEIPVTNPTKLQHGDWIRFGENTRFQVCLIDGPSR